MKKNYYILTLSALFALVAPAGFAEARLVYSTEADGVHAPEFYLNQDDTSDDFVDLNFGTSSGAQLRYDVVNDKFFLNKDLDLSNQTLEDFKIQTAGSAPVTCNVGNLGYVYYDTAVTALMVCNEDTPASGTYSFNSVEDLGAGSITTSEILDGTITFADLNNTDITLADFTNDAGFITTDTDTTYTAGTGITLTGTVFSNDLGTDIATGEIQDDAVTSAKVLDATLTADDLAANAVQDSEIDYTDVTLNDFTNDAGFITTDTNTTYTAGTGITLTGTVFSNDLGASIDETEIDADSIQDSEMDYSAVTLNDFTNDAGFITTDTDTTYTGSGGVTLTGTNFTADLGTSVDATEIDTDAVNDDEINYANVTLNDFTNDAGFITTDTDTTYTAGTGITLTGTVFSNDLGTDIGIGEIANGGNDQVLTTTGAGVPQWENKSNFATAAQGTLADSALQSGDNVSDLTNDAGYITTDTDTTYTAGTGITLTGTVFSNDLGTDIDAAELATNSVNDDEINYTNVTLNDFTNDAGFITTDTDTTYTAGTGITLTGTVFSNDLGASIDTAEIGDDQVTVAKIGGAGNNQVLTSDGSGNPQWEDRSNFATSSLTTNNIFVGVGGVATDTAVSGDLSMIGGNFSLASNSVQDAEIDYSVVTLNDFTNDAGFITTDTDTTYTAGTGITLTGTVFSNDLGTDIDAAELATNSVNDDEINYTNVTLNDFTNDAGFITTDTDTTYTASDGVTLTGTNFTNAFSTAIETGEITDGTITFADLNNTDITLADFTNDAGYITTDTDTTYTAGTGITLTGTVFSNDLGASIDETEIDADSIQDSEIDYSAVTLNDFTNDAGFITTDTDTTYTGSGGVTLTGTNFTADLGTSVDATEIDTDAVNDDEINYTNVTLNDFTNDAGFITTDTDTTYTGSGGVTLTGTNFTADLGTSVDATEIDTDAVNDDEINYANVTLNDFTNDAGFITTDTDTTYTGSGGVTLTGTNFTADLGTSVETGEITDGTITFADLNNTDITLADFTNDAGFITTDTDTTYTAGTGMTLTGTVFSNDLGASIDETEIDADSIQDSEIDYSAVTLNDFTNDAGFITTDTDTTYTAGTGITLTGTVFSNDLGASIDETEIDADSIQDSEMDYSSVTLADFTNDLALTSGNIFVGSAFGTATGVAASGDVNVSGTGLFTIQNNSVDGTDIALGGDTAGDTMYYDGTDWVRLAVGTAGQVLQVNTGATAPEWATAAATDSIQDADGNTQIQVEEGANDDTIRFDTAGGERMIIESDGDILMGAAAETIANASFTMDGDDVFMADSLGVEGAIYTDATATKYQTVDIFGCVRGSASAGTVAGGNSAVVRFDAGGNSQMRCSFAVPDDWQAGTDINIETFYSPSDNTAGDVKFVLRHAAKAVGEVIANGDFTDTVAAASAISASTELEMYELVEDIPAAGLALDDMVNINLRREPGDAADTYAGDINIHMIRVAYTGKRLE